MHLDVLDLRTFYYRTKLGRSAQSAIRQQVTTLWPSANDQTVAGFGFAAPLLRPYLKDARRVTALMPGQQGVMPWPPNMPNVSVLSEETDWPVEGDSLDKLIVMHGLETSEHPIALLDECYRALAPEGRALFIVPNRAGLWSRRDGTPFGFGRPYSRAQLDSQLRRHGFVPEHQYAALYQMPTERRFWLKASPLFERIGRRLPSVTAGGVLLVEVSKRVQPPGGKAIKDAIRKPARSLEGLAEPALPSHAGRHSAERGPSSGNS